jgi:putative transcriptional regulator
MIMVMTPHNPLGSGGGVTADERRDMLLLEYACGALDEAASLMVASWLALSPEAKKIVAQYERLGGAMMCQTCQPERMAEDSLRQVLDKLECSERAAALAANRRTAQACNMHFPEPLQAYLDSSPAWRGLCRGIDMFELPLDDCGHAMLFRTRPGAAMDHIRPDGFDMTLVLDGAFGDGAHLYRRGDFLFADHQSGGRYVADTHMGCLSFVIGAHAPQPAPAGPTGLGALIRSFFRRSK